MTLREALGGRRDVRRPGKKAGFSRVDPMAAPAWRHDTHNGEPTVIEDIGGRLRRARKDRDLSLSDLAARTKLSVHVLQAIERNQFARLPGGMFRKAYVRMIAAELGLDPEAMAAEYGAQFEPCPPPQPVPGADATVQAKLIEQLTPSPKRSIATLLALAAPAAAWFMFQREPIPPAMPPADAGDASVAAPAAITFLHTNGANQDVASLVDVTHMPLRVEIAAIGRCWIAADTDGARAIYRLVEPGERVVLEARDVISLRLGDAGSVMVSINDGAERSFGGDGEVITLAVTPDNVDRLRGAGDERRSL